MQPEAGVPALLSYYTSSTVVYSSTSTMATGGDRRVPLGYAQREVGGFHALITFFSHFLPFLIYSFFSFFFFPFSFCFFFFYLFIFFNFFLIFFSVSAGVLFYLNIHISVKWVILQLCHGENRLHFDEKMTMYIYINIFTVPKACYH